MPEQSNNLYGLHALSSVSYGSAFVYCCIVEIRPKMKSKKGVPDSYSDQVKSGHTRLVYTHSYSQSPQHLCLAVQ